MPLQHSIQSSCGGFWRRCWVERMFRELCQFSGGPVPGILDLSDLHSVLGGMNHRIAWSIVIWCPVLCKFHSEKNWINWMCWHFFLQRFMCWIFVFWLRRYSTPDVSGAGYQHFNCRLVSCYFWIPRENKSLAGGCDVMWCVDMSFTGSRNLRKGFSIRFICFERFSFMCRIVVFWLRR